MVNNGAELLFKTFSYSVWQRVTVNAVSPFHTGSPESLLCAWNFWREFPLWNGKNFFNHIGYFVGVVDYNLPGSFFTEVAEFLKHLVCSAHIEALAVFRILIPLSRHEYVSVYGGLRLVVMGVGSCHYRLSQPIGKFNDFTVQVSQPFLIGNSSLVNEKLVVYNGLYLQIVVEICNPLCLLLRQSVENTPENLSCFTGGAYDYSIPVSLNYRLWQSGFSVKVVQMGI